MTRFLLGLATMAALVAGTTRADELADLAAFAKTVKGEFRDYKSGGRSSLTLPSTATDADLVAIAKLAPQKLQSLRFEDSKKITDSGFAALAGMPGLEVLWLPPQLTDKAFDGVATRLPGLTNVLIFGSSFSPTPVTATTVKSLAALKSLRHISVTGSTGMDDACWAAMADVPTLESVVVNSPKLTGVGIKQLAACKKLKTFDIIDCPLSEAGVKEIGSVRSLNYVTFTKCAVTDAGVAGWAGLTDLRSIHLTSNPITDEAFKTIGQLPRLYLVSVSGSPITDAGLKHLTGLKGLEQLTLRDTKVTDAGLVEFKKLMPKVQAR